MVITYRDGDHDWKGIGVRSGMMTTANSSNPPLPMPQY